MSKAISLCEGNEGFVEFAVGEATQTVDVFYTCNRLAELNAQEDLSLNERHQKIIDFMKDIGFPPVSHYVAVRFSAEINRLARELEKKAGIGIDSPAG